METVDTVWRKSSYSGANGGQCVEVASTDRVMVRDTKDKDGAKLAFSPGAWQAFTARVKRSLAFDLEPGGGGPL
jgi:Domain of unknown function (DUF397)